MRGLDNLGENFRILKDVHNLRLILHALDNLLLFKYDFRLRQWRREDFGSGGGEQLATKRLSRARRRGSGGEGPRMVAKFKILKRFKVLKMNPFSKNINIFLARKIHFFLRKRSKNWIDFTKISWVFEKITLQIINFMEHPLNPEKFSFNSII